MIGGVIIDILTKGETTLLWCMNRENDEGAIFVKNEAEMPEVGDRVWWQGHQAFWTPKDERFVERVLQRVGYNFDPRRGLVT